MPCTCKGRLTDRISQRLVYVVVDQITEKRRTISLQDYRTGDWRTKWMEARKDCANSKYRQQWRLGRHSQVD
jgi:hypothetical protein